MKSEKSEELYQMMMRQGYPKDFCEAITKYLNTDFTAKQMIGYLSYYQQAKPEQVVDEMLAILELRHQIMEKKDLERVNANWNEFLNEGF